MGGSGFFSTGFGSGFGLVSATGFGGSGFFSTGFSSGLGIGGGEVSVTTGGFSLILPTASSSTGFASATFSTSGFGFSFLPVFIPAVTLASWSAEITSTGKDSSGIDSNALLENDTKPHPITSTCRATDATRVLSTFTFTASGSLLHFGDQREPLEASARQQSHHLGHRSVIRLLVRPHEYTLVEAAAGVGNRL